MRMWKLDNQDNNGKLDKSVTRDRKAPAGQQNNAAPGKCQHAACNPACSEGQTLQHNALTCHTSSRQGTTEMPRLPTQGCARSHACHQTCYGAWQQEHPMHVVCRCWLEPDTATAPIIQAAARKAACCQAKPSSNCWQHAGATAQGARAPGKKGNCNWAAEIGRAHV